jgi:hypothetical protein
MAKQREIKFRAWDKNNKKMLDWSASSGDTGFWESVGIFDTHFELMEFTGLKDKNGIDIYEGDILNQLPGFGCEWNERIGVITFQYTSFWLDSGSQSIPLDDHDCNLEVIGNIYDHDKLSKMDLVLFDREGIFTLGKERR